VFTSRSCRRDTRKAQDWTITATIGRQLNPPRSPLPTHDFGNDQLRTS
jgi:hypothetical protein